MEILLEEGHGYCPMCGLRFPIRENATIRCSTHGLFGLCPGRGDRCRRPVPRRPQYLSGIVVVRRVLRAGAWEDLAGALRVPPADARDLEGFEGRCNRCGAKSRWAET